MAVFQDPPLVVDGIDLPARLVDATVGLRAEELAELAETATVVLTGPLKRTVALARQVPELGPAVVVEVDVARGTFVDPAPFDDLAALGIASGAHLAGEASPEQSAVGWEIGAVTWLIANGVRTVRGVAPRRLGRLVAVARSLDDALEPVAGP